MWRYIKCQSAERLYWGGLFLATVPTAFLARVLSLHAPFGESHPLRQTQTAITAYYMARGESAFFDYSSPMGGVLWNFVREFPLFQLLVSWGLRAGFDITFLGRALALSFFLVSLPFFYRLIKNTFGSPSARWSTLFYFILPFFILYSRTCLVDIVAFSLLVVGLFFGQRFTQEKSLAFWLFATFFLILGGLVKLTIWFAPVLTGMLYLLWREFKTRNYKTMVPYVLSGGLQLLIVGAWAAWAEHVYYRTGNPPGNGWLFGHVEGRLDYERYITLFVTLSDHVLSWYLWVPIVFGVYSLRKRRDVLFFLLLGSCLTSLVFFNVSIYHNYYFIPGALPLLILSGVGLVQIFEFSNLKRIALLAIFGALFLNSYRGFAANLGNLFSVRNNELQVYENIEKLTHPKDILLPDEYNDAVLVAYHSRRLVSMIRSTPLEVSNPSVFFFLSEKSLLHDRIKAAELFIDGAIGNTYVYRVREVEEKKFNPLKHLAVRNKKTGEILPKISHPTEMDVCQERKDFLRLEYLAPKDHVLSVKFNKRETPFMLPPKEVLHLPGHSPWGCKVQISSRLPEGVDYSKRYIQAKEQESPSRSKS